MGILKVFKLIPGFFILSVLASCGSSGGDASTGRVSLLITDGITDDFDQVNLTVEKISFLGEDNGHETIVFDEARVIDLLALKNHSDLLVTAVIPARTYDKIRLHVSRVELVDFDGECQPGKCITKLPANGKVDLNPRGTFEVVAGGHLMIELDADMDKSIHPVKKGNGEMEYNFRPVVFVNILGVNNESKLVLLDGKVLNRTETGFQLCDVEVLEVNDTCLTVLMSENTVVQDDLIELVPVNSVVNGKTVTVLGKASSGKITALHVVMESDAKTVSDLALFTGAAASVVDAGDFTMDTDGNVVCLEPLATLTISLVDGSGVRVFDKYGNEVDVATIAVCTDADVFGKAEPGVINAEKVKAAFIIIDNDKKLDQVSGTIAAINDVVSQLTVTVVNDTFSGDVCVDAENAIIFILDMVDGKVVFKEITFDNLQENMPVDVYGKDDGLGCVAADVILAAEPLEVTPAGAALLVTENHFFDDNEDAL